MPSANTHIADRRARAAARFIAARGLILRGERVLAAVSGGADSTALLAILRDLSIPLGFSLEAAHFNHGLRAEAAAELEHVRAFAASLGLPFHEGAGDVRAAARAAREPIEEAARKARYRFFEHTAARVGADRIATGHTRSDQIETVLMRMLRGTGLRGLAGIPAKRGTIIRPLLAIDRADTVSYCRDHGFTFVEDASNRDTRILRNRIRLELLPLLETRYVPRVRENLLRLSDHAGSVVDALREKTRPAVESSFREAGPGRWRLETAPLTALDDAALVILLGDLFAERLGCDMDFTRAHYDGLVRLVRDPRAMGKRLSLPGLRVRREHGGLSIVRFSMEGARRAEVPPAALPVPGRAAFGEWTVTAEIVEPAAVTEAALRASSSEAFVDRSLAAPPLFIRHPLPGDRMQPFGMRGRKKLSDIFIDKKIPSSERASALVIADRHGILWVAGVAASERCRVRAATREILRIRVEQARNTSAEQERSRIDEGPAG